MQIELAEALYYIGHLPPEHLGDVGVALLTSGRDTPAVRELAWLSKNATWREVGNLFERVLAELERRPLTASEAAYRVAELAANAIVANQVTPYEGATQIGVAYQAAGQPEDLRAFYYWADEWRDHPEYRDACDTDIRNEAVALLRMWRTESV